MRQKSGPEKQPAEDAIRDIRRATRRHFSPEEKIRVVLEGLRGEESIAELCRREGIASSMYYGWSKEFPEAGKRRLAGGGVDFGAQASAGATKALGIRPPFLSASAGGVLMRPHDGGIDHQPFEIGLARQRGKDLVQSVHLDPAVVAPLHRLVACPTAWADRASDSLSGPPLGGRSRNRRLLVRGPRLPLRPRQAQNASSRSHWSSRSASQSTADLQKSALNFICAPFGNPRSLNRQCDLAKERFSWKIFYGHADPMAGELFRIDPLGSPRVGASAVVMRQR